jgi:hypothetical protein
MVAQLYRSFQLFVEPERVHKNTPGPSSEPDEFNPFNILTCALSFRFPIKNCVTYFYPTRDTRAAHLILSDFIILILFGEECKLLISLLCSFLKPPLPVTSSLVSLGVTLITLFSNYPQSKFVAGSICRS